MISQLSPRRLRIAIDGRTGAGKTSFGHELAAALRKLGRPTLRASLDDFKHPWRDVRERGYDRVTGEGYYRNAYDFRSAVDLLLVPAGPDGRGEVVLCAHDPLTGVDYRATFVTAPDDAVLSSTQSSHCDPSTTHTGIFESGSKWSQKSRSHEESGGTST